MSRRQPRRTRARRGVSLLACFALATSVAACACGDSSRRSNEPPPQDPSEDRVEPNPPRVAPHDPVSTPTPAQPVAGLSDVTRVSAGNSTTCALRRDGTVWCWGVMPAIPRVEHSPERTPRQIADLSGVTYAESGMTHGCAVVAGGRVRCWGENDHGQLGDGTTHANHRPVDVAGLVGAVDLALPTFGSCARMGDGTVQCWGSHQVGELGIGDAPGGERCESGMNVGPRDHPCRLRPIAVPGLTGVTQLAAGASHVCAVLDDGTARCWGHNEWGQLGDGHLGFENNRNVPVEVVGLTDAAGIAAGNYHTCAWLRDGTVHCWGEGRFGQHGPGAPAAPSARPREVEGLRGVRALAAGDAFTCAILSDGHVRCWGDTRSLCPPGSPTSLQQCRGAPTPAPAIEGARQIDVGGRHACAVLGDSAVTCWGDDYGGVLGR